MIEEELESESEEGETPTEKWNLSHGELTTEELDIIIASQNIQFLSSVVKLDLSFNSLLSIPASIAKLSSLESLYLYGNPLKSLIELRQLAKLKRIWLSTTTQVKNAQLFMKYLIEKPLKLKDEFTTYVMLNKKTSKLEIVENVQTPPNNVRILSYNILAKCYFSVHARIQQPSNKWCQQWKYRKRKLLRDLIYFRCDILCLQEVEDSAFEYFKEKLEQHLCCYDQIFSYAELREIYEVDVYQPTHKAGNAVFWNRNKFKLIEKHSFLFLDLLDEFDDLVLDPFFEQRFTLRDNSFTLVLLTHLATGQTICVANTHIYWNPVESDVKLMQTYCLLRKIHTLLAPRFSNIPVMICGDFNSMEDSEVYSFMSHGLDNKIEIPKSIFKNVEESQLHNYFELKSAYFEVLGKEPKFTNYTPFFQGVLDYIWVTKQLQVEDVLLLEEVDGSIRQQFGIPNSFFPSDHLPILANLALV